MYSVKYISLTRGKQVPNHSNLIGFREMTAGGKMAMRIGKLIRFNISHLSFSLFMNSYISMLYMSWLLLQSTHSSILLTCKWDVVLVAFTLPSKEHLSKNGAFLAETAAIMIMGALIQLANESFNPLQVFLACGGQRLHLREEPRLLPPLPARRSGMDDFAVLSA